MTNTGNETMKCDIAFSGVGGQGVLTVAAMISAAAQRSGLYVKQSEVHGMAQRGGSVLATTRISDQPVRSILVGGGTAGPRARLGRCAR